MLVLRDHAARRVDYQQHAVGALHRVDAAQQAVALESVSTRGLLANSGGVDQNHGHAVEAQLGVDRVACRSWRWADECALVTEQGVEQR